MIIAFVNLKGGCGKSTSAVHLSRWLLDRDFSVLLVDADSQATSSRWLANLDDEIACPEVLRLTEPDPLLDELPRLAETYDRVVVDGAGGLAEVQRTILLLADLVLISVQPSVPDISASAEVIKAVGRARQIRGGAPRAFTFLTRVVPNTLLLGEAREVLSFYDDVLLLSVEIPQRQVVADVMGQGATLFDLSGRAAKDVSSKYCELFEEMNCG